MKERGRPRLNFSEPTRVQQMRAMMQDPEERPDTPPIPWADLALNGLAYAAMVAAAVFVVATLFDLW